MHSHESLSALGASFSLSWMSEQDRSVQPSVSGSSDTRCALNLLFQKPVRMRQELTLKLYCKKVFEGHG